MVRYNRIIQKDPREIVLLKSRPCQWGRCFFCDYIDDNSEEDDNLNDFNEQVLKNVTGEFEKLEVINSASVFELPKGSLKNIKDVVINKGIKEIYFECHWSYRNRLREIQDYFLGIKVRFNTGIETFDNDFRNKYLKKGAAFESPEEVAKYFYIAYLLVGIQGQTKEMIAKDVDIVLNYFDRGRINKYENNSTPVKADPELIQWFREEYGYLEDMDKIEILWNTTDFGVGAEDEY